MATKNNPGKNDCYAKLAPDEPYFLLRAQDISAASLVDEWADGARLLGVNEEKIAEARKVATEMQQWPNRKVPD